MLVLLLLLPPAGLVGCREAVAASLLLNFREVFLPPGGELPLEVLALYPLSSGETETRPVREGLVFTSSRPELVRVDREGRVFMASGSTGTGVFLSGESAEVTVSLGELSAVCRFILRRDPRETLDSRGYVKDPGAMDVLVNKTRRLPDDYIPPDLVRVEVPTCLTLDEVNHLRLTASLALSALFETARAEEGYTLTARSGYRAWKTQDYLYRANVQTHGQAYADQYSARPGTSEHQTGLVMDITSPGMNFQLDDTFGWTAEGRWTAANAHRFGFIIRYPLGKEEITGYAYEPWHLRYVGPALAEEVFRRKISLEEFFLLPDTPW